MTHELSDITASVLCKDFKVVGDARIFSNITGNKITLKLDGRKEDYFCVVTDPIRNVKDFTETTKNYFLKEVFI